MEVLLLAIYGSLVWLVFIKLKWLPWNTMTQVIAAIIPIVGLAATILLLNVFAPSSSDVRVIKYVVQVVPQVRGRVIDVPVKGNDYVRKGQTLFRIDPTPYQLAVETFEAQLANAEGASRQLQEQRKSATATAQATRVRLDLARMRVQQYQELAETGAGDAFALQKATTDVQDLKAQLAGATAAEAQVRERLLAQVDGDLAEVAEIKAQLANARWELSQTKTVAPANGWVMNLQLRPGSFVTPLAATVALTFVEDDYQIIALYQQNELSKVTAGDAAELTLATLPGKIIKARVQSIVWGQGQGQIAPSGVLPQTGTAPVPPGRFAVKLEVDEKYRGAFLAAGAAGDAAIYTARMEPIHIIRKVILRVSAKLNYLILKLH